MTPQEEAAHMKIVGVMLTDNRPTRITLTVADLVLTLGAVDLVLRAPFLHFATLARFDAIQLIVATAIARRHKTAAIARSEAEQQYEVLELPVMHVWLLITGLQLVDRHPELKPDDRQHIRRISGIFEQTLTAIRPECAPLLALGWDHTNDQIH